MALDDTVATRVPPPQARAKKRRRARSARRAVLGTLTAVAFLAIWEIAQRTALPSFVARPSSIITSIPTVSVKGLPSQGLGGQPSFGSALWASYSAILEGILLGTLVGVILGMAMGRIPQVGWFFATYVRGLYAMPLIALVPLITLWLGYSSKTRLAVIFIAVVLPVTVTTADGTRATPRDLLDVGQVFGARTHNKWFGIALPAALPHIMAGLQLAISRAVTNCVAAEVLANVSGLGQSTFALSAEFQENYAFVYVIALSLFAIILRALVLQLRKLVAPWYLTSGT